MGRSAKWYPAGTTLDDTPVILDDGSPGPMFVMQGVTGIEAPEYTVELQSTPGVRGGRFMSATAGVRTIRMPIHLCAPTRTQMRRLRDDIVDAMDPEAGPGVLALSDAIGEDSGEVRCISAVYSGGLKGDEAAIKVGGGRTYWEFILEFSGLDFWYSPEPAVGVWRGKQGQPWFPRRFPYRFSPYGLDVVTPFELGGNAVSWPTVRIGAPFTRVRLTNSRSGDWWQVQRSSDETAALIIDMQPGQMRVRTDDGRNAYGLQTGGSVPLALLPGDDVLIDADGISSATMIRVEALQRWKSGP